MSPQRLKVYHVGNASYCGGCGWPLEIHWRKDQQLLSVTCANADCAQAGLEGVWPSAEIELVAPRVDGLRTSAS